MRRLLPLTFLLLACFAVAHAQPTPDAGDGTLRRIRVPILMYHYVGTPPPDANRLRRGLTVDLALFLAHVQYLADNGYHTISLTQLDDALRRGTPLPDNPIILTFDDGYADHYVNVFPILQEYGMTATFFIVTGFIDQQLPGYLTWEQIRAMSDAGMSMEAHTQHHPDLRSRDYDFLVFEILGSIQTLATNTGRPVHMFAYPAGQFDPNTLAVLASMDVRRAVTTEPGTLHTTDNRLLLPRLRVNPETGVDAFAALLRR